jgi:hypothetical protein
VVDLECHDESGRGIIQLGSLGRAPHDVSVEQSEIHGQDYWQGARCESHATHLLTFKQLKTILTGQILKDESPIAVHVSRVGLSSPFRLEAKVTFRPAVRRPGQRRTGFTA